MRVMVAGVLAACGGAAPPLALPDPLEVDVVAAGAAADDLVVRPLEVDGYRGGEIVATVPATPERVVAALTDFEHADGHRAWAERHELVSRDRGRVVARWHFKGKLGIDPTVVLEFETAGRDGETVVTFRQPDPVFGLAAFFGDHRVRPHGLGSLLISRVFIDSGLLFVGASDEDIAAGLREDVRRIRAWLGAGPQVWSPPTSRPEERVRSTR